MRCAVLAVLLLAGCKDKPAQTPTPTPPPPPADARADRYDWSGCNEMLKEAALAPRVVDAKILLENCRVCDGYSFDPLVHWNKRETEGGPKRAEIEKLMDACAGFCVGDAKLKFLGTLDDARGRTSRTPWKQLAAVCKERVSAVPDDRFVDGIYFALDRIARRASERSDIAAYVQQLEVALPPLSITGQGPPLPAAPDGYAEGASDFQITVLGPTISVGTLPRARLTRDGLQVDLGHDGYPGKPVTISELAAAVGALTKGRQEEVVMLLAPRTAPAKNLVPVIAAASKVARVHLAVRSPASLEGWDLPGAIAMRLVVGGKDAIRLTESMTVQDLADEIGRRRLNKANQVGIIGP